MNIWQYKAIRFGQTDSAAQRGELAGESAADVRAALRRIGLQVIDLRPIRSAAVIKPVRWMVWLGGLKDSLYRHLRRRRQAQRAELHDSLATMLQSGLPLLEAIETIIASTCNRRSPWRSMLLHLREQLRSGSSLGQTMAQLPGWFDPSEIAMVNAGQHGGTLTTVLQNLAQRHQRAGELTGKLLGALAYPAIVSMVAIGVVVFLSVKTLPDLTAILVGAKIEIPALTTNVMAIGQFMASHWMSLTVATVTILILALVGIPFVAQRKRLNWLRKLHPRLLRRLTVARFSQQLAQMLGSGVPMVEALRVIAPTSSGLSAGFAGILSDAADRVERGQELSDALDDPHWFDPEFRRLLDVGQASGELDELLVRIGERYSRQAHRLIDRLASLLEPAVILLLAGLVGTVVMAAVLPLLRLQEIL
ncbi:MAG: type II secretion system F family protein [Phycisphaerales bacterium]|nr:type II secretion system F family protein [Phycisphaerales bacterium]